MSRCLVTRDLPGEALTRLRRDHEVEVWPRSTPPTPQALRELAADCDGLICMLSDSVDADLIAGADRLRAIANYAVGVDNIDLDAARARGIQVGNTPDILTDSTADLTMALILACARRLVEARNTVLEGRWLTWEPAGLLGMELRDRVLGIVGYGRIGRAVAHRAEAFGMRIAHTGSDRVGLHELIATADVLTLHCPLTPTTRHLIDARALSAMKPGAILINTARGPIVDGRALADALRRGTLSAAGLDVTDPEPLPADDPLLGAPNLLALPHIGSATHAARGKMADYAVDNLLAALDGREMPHRVA